MKILNAEAIRAWDQYTIQHEPVSAINLMERAAGMCVEWIRQQDLFPHPFIIFCGKGNNGGDGLAIARLLTDAFCQVTVYIIESGQLGTPEFQVNLARLHQVPVDIRYIHTEENFHEIDPNAVVIDALIGAGLNRKLDGITGKLAIHINQAQTRVIAIDIPSGLFTDHSSTGNIAVKATDTLSFQCYKPAFLVAENADTTGNIHLLDIGLHPDFYQSVSTSLEITDHDIIHRIYKPRNRFAHKGNFGHALLVAGSYGKIGAALLAAQSCLRSGAGLLTCHIPACGYSILQSMVPEAMVSTDFNSSFNTRVEEDLARFDVVGIGPGLGTASETKTMLQTIFNAVKNPMVVDADALNIISSRPELLSMVPKGSVLTPHPKEFERLFGPVANDFDRIQLAIQKANELNLVIVLKGHHSLIALPGNRHFFNSTGNAGMATAGSGDVLTGILTGLLAQGYSSADAAVLGVYLHGLAGDIAAKELSMEAMLSGDIVRYLAESFSHL